jgi:conserved oligomeric Golgi complex subunit 8
MSDLYELLAPSFDVGSISTRPFPASTDPITQTYLTRLTTLSLESLTDNEGASLLQSAHSLQLSLQKLSNRSHKAIISSSDHLSTISTGLPLIANETGKLQGAIPAVDEKCAHFSKVFGKNAENPLLERRRKAMLLSRNIERLTDILDLPSLLSSAISSSSTTSTSGGSSSATNNYASALDLHAHIKRLHTLYPTSPLITSISIEAEDAIRGLTSNLITMLRSQGIKLAGAMRTIGWLRRVAPELDGDKGALKSSTSGADQDTLGSLFLVCRLANLLITLDALSPLRDLADQESERRLHIKNEKGSNSIGNGTGWAGGQQTERYLKRYIEIFREQSFAIISMYKSIFPASFVGPGSVVSHKDATMKSALAGSNTRVKTEESPSTESDPLRPLPSPLATFPSHLLDLLTATLRQYLPNVSDKSARESLLTQVLYCAGSLGRLGGDFSMIIASLGDSSEDEDDEDSDVSSEDSQEGAEWVEVIKKHRVLAGRLELLASGVGTGSSAGTSRGSSPVG